MTLKMLTERVVRLALALSAMDLAGAACRSSERSLLGEAG